MFAGKLKTYFTINTAVFLFFGMLLIDLVIVRLNQKTFLKSEISKGSILIAVFENSLQQLAEKKNDFFDIQTRSLFHSILKKSGFTGTFFSDSKNRIKYSFGDCGISNSQLALLGEKSILTGKTITGFYGSVWGVFWKEKQYLVVSAPIVIDQQTTASVCLVQNLAIKYSRDRQTQYIIFLYILINTAILAFISVARLSRVTIKPLKRLLNNAEKFREDDKRIFLIHATESDEFSRLSFSLNRMLKRIANDKEKLKKSVKSLKKTNIELKKAQKELVKAEKLASVGRLSAGIAHEIGNPVSIIIGYLELLKQQEISENERADFTDRIEAEINRINIIIRQFLDFSRNPEEKLTNVSVHEIINDIVQVFKNQPILSDITIKLRLFAKKDIIAANPDQLRQVFINLIINAADSITSASIKIQGEIYIHTENIEKRLFNSIEPVQMLKIGFTDNGSGISETDLENIFDPFYTTKKLGKGTGLGLYVCFMIIDKMGGEIKAESNAWNNTTITIFLPLLN